MRGCRFRITQPLRVQMEIDPGGLDLLANRLSELHLPALKVSTHSPAIQARRIAGPAEHYTLDVSSKTISLGAADPAAEFDALATLAQLVGQGGSPAALPCVHIDDRPALAWRFLSDDVSRGQLPTMQYFTSRVRRLASYKFNGYSIYIENSIVRAGHENETRADGITKAQLRQLALLCARYHMTFIPEQEAFAHLDRLLTLPQYSDVRERDLSDIISPAAPRTYSVLTEIFNDEFSGVPNIRLIHIGADETIETGSGRSAELVKQLGYPAVFAQHVSRVAQIVRSLGAQTMIWGDQARVFPQILNDLPKSIVIVPFDYDVEPSYDRIILPIKRAGFTQLVGPSVANVARFFPNLPMAIGNIGGFVGDAKRYQLRGMFVTVWFGAREELYDATWYPAAYAAAAAWEPVTQRPSRFCAGYAELTFGDRHACAAFLSFARLDKDFDARFPLDPPAPQTLWQSDWRVPYFAQRTHLTPELQAEFGQTIEALRQQVDALPQRRAAHEVNAMRLAALRYSILLALLRREKPDPSLVRNAEELHLAEWHYENRPLSATDMVTKPYESWLPPLQNAASSFALPQTADASANSDSRAIAAALAAADPRTASAGFLFEDPVQYIAASNGLDPGTAAALRERVDKFLHAHGGIDVQSAGWYLGAEIHKAMLPYIIKHAYQLLLAVTKDSNPRDIKLNSSQILLSLFGYEGRLSDLQAAYQHLPNAQPSVLNALEQQRRDTEKMVTCFQTFVHEWTTYGDGPPPLGNPHAATHDSRADLPASLRAGFCEP